MARDRITMSGITHMNFPGSPPRLINGKKAIMVVAEEASTGAQTSSTAAEAASTGFIPFSLLLLIVSEITIASSTSIPTTIINPPKANTLSDMPINCNTTRHPSKENGIPNAVQNAVFISKTKKSKRRTNPNPIIALPRTKLILVLVKREPSFSFLKVTPSGNFKVSR